MTIIPPPPPMRLRENRRSQALSGTNASTNSSANEGTSMSRRLSTMNPPQLSPVVIPSQTTSMEPVSINTAPFLSASATTPIPAPPPPPPPPPPASVITSIAEAVPSANHEDGRSGNISRTVFFSMTATDQYNSEHRDRTNHARRNGASKFKR